MDKQNRLKLFGTFTNSKKLYDKIVNEEALTDEEKSKVKRSNYQYSRAMKDEYDAIVGDGGEDTSSDLNVAMARVASAKSAPKIVEDVTDVTDIADADESPIALSEE